MTYGPIVSGEPSGSEYRLNGYARDSNGEIGFQFSISGDVNDATFPEEADAAFQALFDLLNGSPIFTVGGGFKSWKSNRTVTPTP